MKKAGLSLIVFIVAVFAGSSATFLPQQAHAHCQIPCGIYDDHARVHALMEDAATVEKSVTLINELSGKTDPQSQNQLIRWVYNKEVHAQKIIATITDYFLTQRVKPSQSDYLERLQKHHAIILAAMKAKQNSDAESVETLKQAIQGIASYYPAK
jgi:nickel superoxide dismutase